MSLRRPLLALLVPALLLAPSGCLNWSYRQLNIGDGPADYDRVLPREHARRTPLGLSHCQTNRQGRIDAFVVQVGADRRIYAKWQATYRPGDWLNRAGSYRLRGEYDPQEAGLAEAPPADVLRLVLSQLAEVQVDRLQRSAHAWVAAGLVRLGTARGDFATSPDVAEETARRLELIGSDGAASAEVDAAGLMRFEYRAPAR